MNKFYFNILCWEKIFCLCKLLAFQLNEGLQIELRRSFKIFDTIYSQVKKIQGKVRKQLLNFLKF